MFQLAMPDYWRVTLVTVGSVGKFHDHQSLLIFSKFRSWLLSAAPNRNLALKPGLGTAMGGNLRWQLHGDSQIPGNRNPCTLANCTWGHNHMTYHCAVSTENLLVVRNQVEPPKTYETTKQNTFCQCLQQFFCFCLAFAVCCDLCQLQQMRTYFLESSIYIYISTQGQSGFYANHIILRIPTKIKTPKQWIHVRPQKIKA